MPTFESEVLRLVSNVQLVKKLLLQIEWQIQHHLALLQLMTRFITKATPIGYIDSKCYTSKLKNNRTCLIGYSALSMPLLVTNPIPIFLGFDTDTLVLYKYIFFTKNYQ